MKLLARHENCIRTFDTGVRCINILATEPTYMGLIVKLFDGFNVTHKIIYKSPHFFKQICIFDKPRHVPYAND